MRNNFLQELIIGIVLVLLLLFLINPFGFWMPTKLVMTAVAAVAVVFTAFAVFLWREQARDEREALLRMVASRSAYLAGAGVLVLGIIIQSFQHNLDPWLPSVLGIMVLAKIVGTVYSQRKY